MQTSNTIFYLELSVRMIYVKKEQGAIADPYESYIVTGIHYVRYVEVSRCELFRSINLLTRIFGRRPWRGLIEMRRKLWKLGRIDIQAQVLPAYVDSIIIVVVFVFQECMRRRPVIFRQTDVAFSAPPRLQST